MLVPKEAYSRRVRCNLYMLYPYNVPAMIGRQTFWVILLASSRSWAGLLFALCNFMVQLQIWCSLIRYRTSTMCLHRLKKICFKYFLSYHINGMKFLFFLLSLCSAASVLLQSVSKLDHSNSSPIQCACKKIHKYFTVTVFTRSSVFYKCHFLPLLPDSVTASFWGQFDWKWYQV